MTLPRKNIIWLVSYPKSGNTWVRIFLQHIIKDVVEDDIGIPSLQDIPIVSNRRLIDRFLGVASSNLTSDEIRDLQPAVYRELSYHQKGVQVLKVHDSFGTTSSGENIFPSDVTRAAIYIARNPLDVVVSYSFHTGKPIQKVIDQLNDTKFEISKNTDSLKSQVCQHLGSWSEHVAGWIEQQHIPVIFITFEHLLENTPEVFKRLLNQLMIPYSEKRFSEALQISDFSNLQSKESTNGFAEKPLQAETFFREGKRNSYINHLSKEQIKIILDNHSEMMIRLGYNNSLQ